MADLKAWYVEHELGEGGTIVYAAARNQARHIGSGHLDAEYAEVTARRRPQYDHLSPHGPTDERLFEDGWWFDCSACAERARKDSNGLFVAGHFYCCPEHVPAGRAALEQTDGR